MRLNLVFQAGGEHVRYTGNETFDLYEHEGVYVLPEVLARTDEGHGAQFELQEVRVEVAGDIGDQGQARRVIEESWRPEPSVGWMTSPALLSGGKMVFENVLIPAFQASAGRPVTLRASWKYVFAGPDRVATAREAHVSLRFIAPRTPVPPQALDLDEETQHVRVPAPIRNLEGRVRFAGFAAVDFGYSSSTVTVFDDSDAPAMVIDPGQATRMRGALADLLAKGPEDVPELCQAWEAQLRLLSGDLAGADPELDGVPLDTIIGWLRGPARLSVGVDPLLDAVTAALENRLAVAGPALRAWLAPRLLTLHDQAFSVPPLAEYFLHRVKFDKENDRYEIPSVVTPRLGHPVSIEMGQDGAGAVRGLKSRLMEPVPVPDSTGRDRRQADSLDLIAHVYRHLVESAESFVHEDREGHPSALTELVVTYPTVTPPGARQRLRDLIEKTLRMEVAVTDFDESVAAGLFFLLRDFGSNRREFGVGALRARARRIGDDPPTWTQNMLVLDIGAGTTDIALIRLTLIDRTEPDPECDDLVRGRYYEVRPEVLNSTGDPQLGGDYLTLRVCYWIKAALVDAMARGTDHPAERERVRALVDLEQDASKSLVEVLLESGADVPAPPALRDRLNSVLPTNWADGGKRQAFDVLWKLAEDVKIDLGGGGQESYTVEAFRLRQVTSLIDESLGQLVPENGLRLAATDLHRLLRPVLAEAVQLATWLVGETLKGERLDRVVLSGKTSMMPLTRQVVLAELGAVERRGGGFEVDSVEWNRAAVTVETQFAKEAASIGAAWGQALRNRAQGVESAVEALSKGWTQLFVNVDNLRVSVPCSLVLALMGRDTTPLLRAGTRMTELDDGRTGARSDRWYDLMPSFRVLRPLRAGRSIGWGAFNYERYAVREKIEVRKEMFSATAHGKGRSLVRAQLEIDEMLTPYLNLCQGRPHYVCLAHVGDTIRIQDHLAEKYWNPIENRLRELPAEVWVRRGYRKDCADSDRQLLFPIWLPGPDDDVTEYFGEFFRESDDANLKPRPGRISETLFSPPEDDDYHFFLRWPGGREEELQPLTPPNRDANARYVVSLDAQGTLVLHRGNLSYWKADSLRDLERNAGSVLRVQMEDVKPEFNKDRDPFSGRH
ncbi:hypothetical protein ABGB12_32205 [Actinocorallia sp. B10E7]|uniref:hypothetical protein n=1 Tax=Actinocorallia sp. B10E7 TaxID=3153558 RepID=UPI00325D3C6B